MPHDDVTSNDRPARRYAEPFRFSRMANDEAPPVARGTAGAPWWRYRRPDLPDGPRASVVAAPAEVDGAQPAVESVAERRGAVDGDAVTRGAVASYLAHQSGLVPGALAVLCAIAAIANGQWIEMPTLGRVFVAGVGIFGALAFGPMLARRHSAEPWLPRLLVWGVAFKLLMSFARYFTLVDGYGGVGDAAKYHEYGVEYAQGISLPLDDLRKTNFVRWTTGVVYNFVGTDMMTGFLVYGLFAFIGAYLWYRAAAVAIPQLNRRWYAMFMFFVPSIAFWPSSIGKEALMQFGIGSAALGTAFLLNGRVLRGILIAVPGGYLMWAVRPHILAMVTLAAGVAYLVGRGRREDARASLMRPIGMVLVAMLAVFATTQAMKFLGMEEFSINAIEDELSEQTGNTSQGGSQIEDAGPVSLTPLSVPQGAVTVLLRPFVWEVESAFQILASLEAAAVTLLLFNRFPALAYSLRQSRRYPFLFYCWTLLAIYSVAFSAIANMGLLVRQRSLVLPALFVLLCVQLPRETQEPALEGAHGDGRADR